MTSSSTEYALHPEWLRDRPDDATATGERIARGQVPIPAPGRLRRTWGEMRRLIERHRASGRSSRLSIGLRLGPSAPPSPAGSSADSRPPDRSSSRTSSTAARCGKARRLHAAHSRTRSSGRSSGPTASTTCSPATSTSSSRRSAASSPPSNGSQAALLAGKSVVTSNKQAIAHHGPALQQLAERQGRQLRFEAAVGGAMPIVRAVGDGLAGDRVDAHRRDPERHDQRRAVAAWRRPAARSQQALADARAHAATRKPTPPRSRRRSTRRAKLAILCALAFGLRVEPAAIETRSSRR